MVTDPLTSIRAHHGECLTKSCRENKCGLQLDGIRLNRLAIIQGTKYQRHNGFPERLCDRIIFYGLHGFILAAVELKGGGSIHLSRAIAQIQNGLKVAGDIVGNHVIRDWFPLLIYSGHVGPAEIRLLRNKTVEFRGHRKNVIKKDCNTRLSEIISP